MNYDDFISKLRREGPMLTQLHPGEDEIDDLLYSAADAIASLQRARDECERQFQEKVGQLASAEEDARRYRWLRDVGNTGFVALANVPDRAFKGPMGADAVDQAIDEAMQREPDTEKP